MTDAPHLTIRYVTYNVTEYENRTVDFNATAKENQTVIVNVTVCPKPSTLNPNP
jgi:hypothetical protein